MDERLRRKERRATTELDLEDLLALAHDRRRSAQLLAKPGHLRVGGPLLAAALRAAFEGQELRPVEILRAAGVAERGLEKRIRALRGLIRGQAFPWPVVREWAAMLGFETDLLLALCEAAQPPKRTSSPSQTTTSIS